MQFIKLLLLDLLVINKELAVLDSATAKLC